MISVHPFGRYSHRQPLAYAPLQVACADNIALSDDFAAADIVLVSHNKDLLEGGAQLQQSLKPHQRLVMLSEEPLWDTVWFNDPLTRVQSHDTQNGPLTLTVLNHHTSGIYDFDRIPYFLLTEWSFFVRYSTWFARNAQRSTADWRHRWEHPEHDVAFLAELRQDEIFDIRHDAQDLYGLGAHRTRIALNCDGPRVLRSGAGWNTLPPRQDLDDWHMQKFLDLDGKCRLMSAIENTHQNAYVTEKIFDAFAIGAIPLYIADPQHRVHDLVPKESFVNLVGLSPQEAAARIMAFELTPERLEAFVETQARFAALFSDPEPWQAELDRVAAALVVEFGRVLEQ